MAAAAWSCVEKMLQDLGNRISHRRRTRGLIKTHDQVTSAPNDVRVSMSTAVWMARGLSAASSLDSKVYRLICKHPAILAPFNG